MNNQFLVYDIDDRRGRKLAKVLEIEITGTLGTLLKAKKRNVIDEVAPFLLELRAIAFLGVRKISAKHSSTGR